MSADRPTADDVRGILKSGDLNVLKANDQPVTVQVHGLPKAFLARVNLGVALGAGFVLGGWVMACALIRIAQFIAWVTS